MYFQPLKIYIFDMLSLENIILDIEPNVSNKQEKFLCKSLQWLWFCMKLYVTPLP